MKNLFYTTAMDSIFTYGNEKNLVPGFYSLMKKMLITVFAFLLALSAKAQAWDLPVIIENVQSFDSSPASDSIEFEPTPAEFPQVGERKNLATTMSEQGLSLRGTISIPQDSMSLKIYFNKQGCLEIVNIRDFMGDTLKISDFRLYPDCPQKGTWFTKTVFDNDEDGEADDWNYNRESKSDFDLKKNECSVPDSLSFTINDNEYSGPVTIDLIPGRVTSGQGMTKKYWFSEEKYFHFEQRELHLFRTVKIKVIKR